MTNRKTTRRALVLSLLSLLLCCSMLVGTTFAWFTDSVTSGKNTIVAGNLDIELEYSLDMSEGSWKTVNGASELFSDTLWEPGHTQVVYLRLSNLGTLALKYNFAMNFTDTVIGKTAEGKDIVLSEHLKYDIVEVSEKYAGRDAARAAVEATAETLSAYTVSGKMLAGDDAKTMALVVYMPETVGNEANYRGQDIPQIDLGLSLVATQQMQENDSFDNTYDEDAGWVGDADTTWYNDTDSEFVIYTAEELAGFAKLVNEGNTFAKKTVKLGEDINLAGANWTPIGTKKTPFKGTFDGQGNTISNMKVALGENSYAGLFGYGNGATVKSIAMNNVNVSAYSFSGSVVGQMYTGTIDDCHVTGSVKITSQYAYAGGIVGGDYVTLTNCSVLADNGEITVKEKTGAGGICGWHTEGDYQLDNLHVKNLKITAWGNVGGILGFIHYENALTNSSVEDVVLTKTRVDGHPSIGLAAGGWSYNASNAITISNNSFKNIELNGNYVAVSSANILYGSEYYGSTNSNFVLNNNTQESITNNLVEVAKVTTSEAITEAIANGQTKLVLGDGTYVIPASAQGKTLTFIGNGNSVIATNSSGSYEGCNYNLRGSTVVFENVTITTDNKTYTGYAGCNATYNNCVINNSYSLYGDSEFNNCTFNISGDQYNIWTWAAPKATFNGCTFNSDGKAILLYGGVNTKLTLNDCIFNDKGGLTDLKAAVEIGNDYGASYELIVNNTVVNGYEINDKGINTGSTLWGNKNSMGTDKLNVVIDGVDVY